MFDLKFNVLNILSSFIWINNSLFLAKKDVSTFSFWSEGVHKGAEGEGCNEECEGDSDGNSVAKLIE